MSLVGSQEKAFQARDVALLLELLSKQPHETEKGCAIALNGLSTTEFTEAMVRGAAVIRRTSRDHAGGGGMSCSNMLYNRQSKCMQQDMHTGRPMRFSFGDQIRTFNSMYTSDGKLKEVRVF